MQMLNQQALINMFSCYVILGKLIACFKIKMFVLSCSEGITFILKAQETVLSLPVLISNSIGLHLTAIRFDGGFTELGYYLSSSPYLPPRLNSKHHSP